MSGGVKNFASPAMSAICSLSNKFRSTARLTMYWGFVVTALVLLVLVN